MLKQKENFATILKSSASDKKSENCDEVAVYVLCEATFKPIDKVINFYLNRFGLYGKFRIGAFNKLQRKQYLLTWKRLKSLRSFSFTQHH